MRLVSQRVRPTVGPPAEGISAFSYWHGGLFWHQVPPPPAPVVRGATIHAVAPGTPVLVRSSLQVLAPDATSAEEFWRAVNAFADALANVGGQLPKTGTFDRVTITFEVDPGLVGSWWDELGALAAAAAAVGPDGRR